MKTKYKSTKLEDFLLKKAKKGSWEKFNQVLEKVSDREPEEYDML
jgi:hypothetical protein